MDNPEQCLDDLFNDFIDKYDKIKKEEGTYDMKLLGFMQENLDRVKDNYSKHDLYFNALMVRKMEVVTEQQERWNR